MATGSWGWWRSTIQIGNDTGRDRQGACSSVVSDEEAGVASGARAELMIATEVRCSRCKKTIIVGDGDVDADADGPLRIPKLFRLPERLSVVP